MKFKSIPIKGVSLGVKEIFNPIQYHYCSSFDKTWFFELCDYNGMFILNLDVKKQNGIGIF